MVPLISPIFPSFPSKELIFGKCSVLIGFSFFPSFWASWMVLAAAHFDFWEVQDISTTPRIILLLEIPQNSIQPGPFL